jgi:MoaA/NifB/PqqE/SkfB family radical SAM enzyme/pimeloyl-ACP methyl ester carboxylesterase
MAPGILLIHGFTGGPEDFCTLPAALARRFGADSVTTLQLPGHDSGIPPRFEEGELVAAVCAAAKEITASGRDLVLIGHSTGGTLALAALAALPDLLPALRLLVLAAVPKRIDGGYLARWQGHARPGNAICFTSLAGVISLVNRADTASLGNVPVLLLQGEEDELVPATEARLWEASIKGLARTVFVPGAGHHLFHGCSEISGDHRRVGSPLPTLPQNSSAWAQGAHPTVSNLPRRSGNKVFPDDPAPFIEDVLLRAIVEACETSTEATAATAAELIAVEPEAQRFYRSAASSRHLHAAPAGAFLTGASVELAEEAAGEPLFVNIEVTTRCNLRCAFCARSSRSCGGRDMSRDTFRRILDLLPHGYRVTLVGLGETLLHPEIAELVADAAQRGRRVALVTNAMALTEETGAELIAAGLDAMTFSLDAVSQGVADLVREGSDMERILTNIRSFIARAEAAPRRISRAVFTAVSTDTVPHLEELVRTVATLGVNALMLSDLNFADNAPRSLWGGGRESADTELRHAVRTAFALGLPVLSVRGLEELGLPQRYHRHLLAPPSALLQRSPRRQHCYSPWQTLAVSVDGKVTVCDCQPDVRAGNLLQDPFTSIWQGPIFREQRRRMLGDLPPAACAICPRF